MKIKPEDRFWIGIYGFTGLIMLIAMGVFGWLAWTSRQEPGIGRVAGARAQVPASPISDERYELLAAFPAPEYVPKSRPPKDFQNAMKRYASQDFVGAIPELRAAANTAPSFIAARFYLGICLLLTGDRISGIQELRLPKRATLPTWNGRGSIWPKASLPNTISPVRRRSWKK
jgi:hypothetical protein